MLIYHLEIMYKTRFYPILVLKFCNYFILVPKHASVLFNPSPSKFYVFVFKLKVILVFKIIFVFIILLEPKSIWKPDI